MNKVLIGVIGMAVGAGAAYWILDRQAQDSMVSETPTITTADADGYIANAESELAKKGPDWSRAFWVQSNFITVDTNRLAAKAGEEATAMGVQLANGAKQFLGMDLSPDTERKLNLLRQQLTLPAPSDAAKNAELATISSDLGAAYGAGKYCPENGECQDLEELSDTIETSRDPAVLLEAWQGWRTISPAMRDPYARQVEIANEGAQELGYADLGAMWRSGYDMPAEDFPGELDRLWGQVKPLYDSLQCHVRAKLGDHYGTDLVPQDGPIPAHLLGNMWAQDWRNIMPLVVEGDSDSGYDLTALLTGQNYDARKMVETGEGFFTSLGFDPLPDTFWDRSLFTKPADRDVVCHPSAWDLDNKDDLRIKMCIQPNAEDFNTIHHELGHNFYQRAYKEQSALYQNGAHDGFHEAIGDTIALSITPSYLVQIGLLDREPDSSGDTGLLMERALEKVAFLPFGLLVDQWRWKVFSGEITPENYNQSWWDLREQYQGVAAPVTRTEADFDPGAKFHVPGNVPYTRYFLAQILQFQFHKAACDIAGWDGPLHRCTIYGNEEVGARFNAMLEMGLSKPWPDALEAFTGTRQMDGSAVVEYFTPLKTWLDEQNEGRSCGW